MKVQTKAVFAMALASGASAFAPSMGVSTRPNVELAMARQQNGENDLVANLGKTAMTFVTASALAFSTVTTVLPVAPAQAAKAPAVPEVVDKKVAKKQAAEMAAAAAEKESISKMSKEEKERYFAKRSLSLSQASLKEYTKFVSDSKGSEAKASKALQAQQKSTSNAKASFKAASDKLNTAKKQKMPSSAIKELTDIEGTPSRISCCDGKVYGMIEIFARCHLTSSLHFVQ